MIVNVARIDWVTVTTFDRELGDFYLEQARKSAKKETKQGNYLGFLVDVDNGTLFCGMGEEKGLPHYILWVSGEAAHYYFDQMSDAIAMGILNVSRIDVQITLDEPEDWSQPELWKWCEKNDLKPRYDRSKGLTGELATVYTGTRAGGRMNRTYEKECDKKKRYIRFETEFGRDYAKEVGYNLAIGKIDCQSVINGEVARKVGVPMFKIFQGESVAWFPSPRRADEYSKTEKWIVNAVAPALAKYVNSHSRKQSLVDMLIGILQR